MNDLHLDRLRDLAANYSDRQGLRIVPMGLAILVQFLPLPQTMFRIPIELICLLGGIAGYPLIGAYYRRRFGHVEELPYVGIPAVLQGILMFLVFCVTLGADTLVRPPFLVSGLAIAAWLIMVAWPSRTVRTQYAVIGPALALISLLPLAGVPTNTAAHLYAGAFGVALVVAGVTDHVRFIHLLSATAAAA